MKLANILLVEDCDADAAFFRDFFERQRICNNVTRVIDYKDASHPSAPLQQPVPDV